ncbi:MAG: class I SAM-dependent methyltransferase [Bdellovibrionota bacterium]
MANFNNLSKIPVVAESENYAKDAKKFANETGMPYSETSITDEWCYFSFGDALSLKVREENNKRDTTFKIDFCDGELRHRNIYGANRSSLLAKAIGARSREHAPYVLDATAGLGRDAFILAGLGCRVLMLERSPVIGVLLEDALRRGMLDADAQEAVSKMSLIKDDAEEYLKKLADTSMAALPDVLYLDPMFPHQKRSALVKKEMRICRDIVGGDPDADKLLVAGLKTKIKRIVVKRMRTAPFLAGLKPNQQLMGKTNRFDLYLK